MATTELLATGTSAANSSDFTLAAGESATLFLKDADGGGLNSRALVYLEVKDETGQYTTIDSLTTNKPGFVLTAIGTFRVRRPAGGDSCGVSRG